MRIHAISMILMGLISLIPNLSQAEIYSWTDPDGVRHFSNTTPPMNDNLSATLSELPYEIDSDRQRGEADQQALQQWERQGAADEEERRKREDLRRRIESAGEGEKTIPPQGRGRGGGRRIAQIEGGRIASPAVTTTRAPSPLGDRAPSSSGVRQTRGPAAF